MGETLRIRNVVIGEGIPKVCVSIIEETHQGVLEAAIKIMANKCDLIEWRIDHYNQVEDISKIKDTLIELRRIIEEIPLIVTFRSYHEGGEKEVSKDYYIELNKEVIGTGLVDLIDVELFMGDEVVQQIVEEAHLHQVSVILSNHDFDQTPKKDELISRLCKMQAMGADLPKLAVMPQSAEDVITLLAATNEMTMKYADRPIITMSMGRLGLVSRIAGEVFGSAITFGAVDAPSAPGQLSVEKLYDSLKVLHEGK